jgi:hypothetical protein
MTRSILFSGIPACCSRQPALLLPTKISHAIDGQPGFAQPAHTLLHMLPQRCSMCAHSGTCGEGVALTRRMSGPSTCRGGRLCSRPFG